MVLKFRARHKSTDRFLEVRGLDLVGWAQLQASREDFPVGVDFCIRCPKSKCWSPTVRLADVDLQISVNGGPWEEAVFKSE